MRTWLRWALLAAFAVFLAPLSATPARADDPGECTFFMPANPVFLRYRSAEEVLGGNCVERDRFEVSGHQYLVVELAGYEPPDRALMLSVIREAAERSASYYGRWFHTTDTMIVIGDMPSRAGDLALQNSDGRSCIISVENAALHTGRSGTDRFDLMRTIAHELFHCVQSTDPELHNFYVPWRDEGTAEYFSGLVVPEAPFNDLYGEHLQRVFARPLYELDESAAPFIFYLGAARSPEAVANFLQGAVHDPSAAGSVASLNNIPGVDELFHRFLEDFFDQDLVDPSGRAISLPVPDFAGAEPITSAQRLELGEARPFMGVARAFEFAEDVNWDIEAVDGGGRGSWRRAEDNWLPLTASISSCDEERTGVLLLTSTAPSTAPSERTANAVERAAAADGAARCQCPIGTWRMNTDSIQASGFRGMFDGPLVSGTVSVTFNADGSALGTYEELTWDNAIDRTSSMRAVLYGSIHWRWRARPWDPAMAPEPVGPGQQGVMVERTVSTTDASWRVEFWARGSRLSERVTRFNPSGGSVNLAVAYCDSETLVLRPNNGVRIDAPPPWTGIYHRAS